MNSRTKLSFTSVIIFVFITSLALFSIFNLPKMENQHITYQEFMKLVEDKKIDSITIDTLNPNEPLEITLKNNKVVYAPNPETENFKEKMLSNGIEVVKKQPSQFLNFLFQTIIMAVVFFFILSFLSKKNHHPIHQQDRKILKKSVDSNRRVAKFTDVAGIGNAKEQLWEVVAFLKNPKRFIEAGARPPRGVLLYGPPGTGKTLLARAVAGEAGVPFFSISGSDFVEKFVGVGAARVRELFEEARKVAPAVIYIDEIDSLAKNRSGMSNDESNQTLNQLLVEMDGFSNNEGIIVLASTNRKDSLDPAVLRPGRFDKHIEVELPDAEERLEILKIHARNKKLGHDVNLERLAKQTAGFSGAQLEFLMNESALMALRHNHPFITWEDVQEAFETTIIGPKKKRSNWSEQEQRVVAYHEAGHALVTHLLVKQPIERITVDPAGRAGGYVMRKPKDSMLKTEKEFYHDICISMAGRVAESIIFGKENVTNGAQQDFRQAAQTALQMVFAYGMSELGALAIPHLDDNMWFRLSEDLKNKAYEEASKIMKKAEKETYEFLNKHKDLLHRLALHLMKVRTIDGEHLDEVLNGSFEMTEPNAEKVQTSSEFGLAGTVTAYEVKEKME